MNYAPAFSWQVLDLQLSRFMFVWLQFCCSWSTVSFLRGSCQHRSGAVVGGVPWPDFYQAIVDEESTNLVVGFFVPRGEDFCWASWKSQSILDVVDRAEREPLGSEENLLKRDFSLAGLLGRYPCLAGSVTVVVAALPSAPEETRTEVRWQRVWWHWKSASEKTRTMSVITAKRKRRRGVALREVALERT